MKANDYPWCVCESSKNEITFKCKRCKQQHKFDNTGMSINRFVEISESFCILHKGCKEKS